MTYLSNRTSFLDYFFCHFGNGDDCGIKQLQSDDFDWILNRKGTPSIRTGPERGHTSQTDDDMYLYLEASHAQKNKQAGYGQSLSQSYMTGLRIELNHSV